MNEQETKMLACVLTQAEKITFAQELAGKITELRTHQSVSASEKKHMADVEKKLNTAVDELAQIVVSGQQWREVAVMVESDWEKKIIRTIRLDTGESIGERAMTVDERQMEIEERGENVRPLRTGSEG